MCLGGFSKIVTQTNQFQNPEIPAFLVASLLTLALTLIRSKEAPSYIPPLTSATATSKLVIVARSIISRRGDLPAPQGHNKMDGTHYTGPPPRSHASRPQIQHRQSSTNSISIRRLPASSITQCAPPLASSHPISSTASTAYNPTATTQPTALAKTPITRDGGGVSQPLLHSAMNMRQRGLALDLVLDLDLELLYRHRDRNLASALRVDR